MRNVYVNGSVETIGNDRDIIDIIRENCGSDFADFNNHFYNFCFSSLLKLKFHSCRITLKKV